MGRQFLFANATTAIPKLIEEHLILIVAQSKMFFPPQFPVLEYVCRHAIFQGGPPPLSSTYTDGQAVLLAIVGELDDEL